MQTNARMYAMITHHVNRTSGCSLIYSSLQIENNLYKKP